MTFVLGEDVYDVRQSKASSLSDDIFIHFGGGGDRLVFMNAPRSCSLYFWRWGRWGGGG